MSNPLTNPLLAAVKLPGRVLPLPSRGVFYKPGEVLHPDVKDGEVEVKPLSALAEMKLKSADLLFSGKIIKELCVECIPSILKPEMLVTKDVDAIFAFLRLVTYGSQLTINSMHTDEAKCPSPKQHTYVVELEPMLSDPRNKILDHKDTLYRVQLSNGQVVNTRPPTYQQAMQIVHLKQELDRMQVTGEVTTDDGLIERIMIADLLAVIGSVEATINGQTALVTDVVHLTEWIRALSKKLLQELVTGAHAADNWGFIFKVPVKCKDCGNTYEHELDLNPVNFFYG